MLTPNDLARNYGPDTILFIKKEFNKRILRLKKAEEFYNNPNTTEADIRKTYDTLVLILKELQIIGDEITEITGEEITTEIAWNGFKDV